MSKQLCEKCIEGKSEDCTKDCFHDIDNCNCKSCNFQDEYDEIDEGIDEDRKNYPIFKINSGDCIIRAKNKEEACFAYANYVAGDLGIECFNVKKVSKKEIDVDYEG